MNRVGVVAGNAFGELADFDAHLVGFDTSNRHSRPTGRRDPVGVATDTRDRGRGVGPGFEYTDGAGHRVARVWSIGGCSRIRAWSECVYTAIPAATIAAASGESRCTNRVPVSRSSLMRSTRNVRQGGA